MDQRQLAYLQAMGIQAWQRRSLSPTQAPAPTASDEPGPAATPDAVVRSANEGNDWQRLRQQVRQCTRCALHERRQQTVFGVGNESADWMIIGEAPGAEEDKRGEPFVGRAGQLLDRILLAVGLSRQSVYIANVVKCRPPNNRDPRPEEAEACSAFLRQQIRLVSPRIILAVGRVAAQNLLGSEEPVGRLRNREHSYTLDQRQIPLVVTYHPAYLLHNPAEKAKVWQDLQQALRLSQRDQL